MKTTKKAAILTVLSAALLASCAGGGGGGSSKVTTINFLEFQGTAGIEWIKEAAARFVEANKDESFEEGKKGVSITVTEKESLDWDTLSSDGNDIYLYESVVDTYKLSAQNLLLDLTTEATPLLDKIGDDAKLRMKGADSSKYYALPSYEWFPGIAYDVDLFDEKNFYFADPSETDVEAYNGNFGTAKLIGSKTATKSVGPDGVAGTYDDGLPSSLQELCIMFDYISHEGFSPMVLAGKASVYSFYLTTALWASLAGGDAMRGVYCNWTDADVEVVTGFSDESIFKSNSGIKAPITETVKLNDDNGYKMYDMSARYYALAFFRLAINEGWFNSAVLNDSNYEAIMAQDSFVREKSKSATLYDASYWCHEAEENGSFTKFRKDNPGRTRNVSYMPMPSQVNGSVTAGNGKKNTLMDLGASFLVANAKVAQNPGKEKAVREFIKFLYTDSELGAFSEKLGLTIPMDYSYDMSKLNNTYYNKLATIRQNSDVVSYASGSTRFLKNMKTFSLYYNSSTNTYNNPQGITISDGYLNGMKKYQLSADYIFDATKLKATVWNQMSK